ncbi:MAG: NYN domain-containing protein [Candidatus Methanomethylophilaceae archaeon]|nr:hypothetical protein [Candidatus Methanomethylophilaceae archaeon]
MCFRTTDKNDRVMIFLDLANIEYGLRDYDGLENSRLDHEHLAETLIDGRKVAGAMAFDTNEYFESKVSSTVYLSRIGYKIVKGHMEDDGQKEVDVALATEMIMHAVRDHYDVAILISGDRDYIPAISAVQSLGKKVEVASFLKSTSHAVMNVSDKYVNIESLPIVEYRAPCKTEICDEITGQAGTKDDFIDVFELIKSEKECQEAD